MSFATPDPAIIALYGETVTHKPAEGDPIDVTMVRDETERLQCQGALLVLFGTMADSGFEVEPVQNDHVEVEGVEYRVYDVSKDWAGGTTATQGIRLYLTAAEE